MQLSRGKKANWRTHEQFKYKATKTESRTTKQNGIKYKAIIKGMEIVKIVFISLNIELQNWKLFTEQSEFNNTAHGTVTIEKSAHHYEACS